jgi:uncharacterized iron-regulated protein
MTWLRALLLVTGLGIVGCATAPAPSPMDLVLGDPDRRGRSVIVRAGVILETRAGQPVDVDALAAQLDGSRLVVFGESHAEPAVQAAERLLLDALARRGRRVLVGLEMLPASVQPALDRWVAGEGTEDDLIRNTHWYRHWGFHFGHYRALLEFARQHRTPLVALNVEREVITGVRRTGLDGLAPGDRAKLPARVDLDSAEHRRLFSAFMGGAHGGMTAVELDGMFRAQCAWDAVMAHNAVQALAAERDPRAVMVVFAGLGHVVYGLGIQRQAALWTREPTAAVVALAAVDDQGRPVSTRASLADFVWGTPPPDQTPVFPSLGASLADKPGAGGPTVTDVRAGSAAERAGLRKGDVVTALDGQATSDKEAVLIHMGRKAWGDQLAIEVLRVGQRQALTTVLGKRPAIAPPPRGAERELGPRSGR